MNGKGQGFTEDLLALIIGLIIFVLALGLLGGVDLLGWVITTSVWTDLSKALAPISKAQVVDHGNYRTGKHGARHDGQDEHVRRVHDNTGLVAKASMRPISRNDSASPFCRG